MGSVCEGHRRSPAQTRVRHEVYLACVGWVVSTLQGFVDEKILYLLMVFFDFPVLLLKFEPSVSVLVVDFFFFFELDFDFFFDFLDLVEFLIEELFLFSEFFLQVE